MELIPKALVVGVFAAVGPGAAAVDKINLIWMQLSRRMGYRQLNSTGEGATFVGASPDDALVIQPPLLQFRSPAAMGFANAADDAKVCLQTAAQHLGATQFQNLGIKHVCHATAPGNDARAFVQHQLLQQGPDDLAALARGGGIWPGLKYWSEATDGSMYTLAIEPLNADPKLLFIDVDAQFPGQADLDRITHRAEEAERYVNETVRPYLENASSGVT